MSNDGHERDAEVEGALHGHEHPAYWPHRSVVRGRATETVDDLIENGHTDTPAARSAMARLNNAARELRDLDEVVALLRRSLLGDANALDGAREWLGLRDDEADAAAADPSSAREPPTGETRELSAQPWVHPTAVLDLAIGSAFVVDEANRIGVLASVQQRITRLARTVSVVMAIVPQLPRGLEGRGRFDAFVDVLRT